MRLIFARRVCNPTKTNINIRVRLFVTCVYTITESSRKCKLVVRRAVVSSPALKSTKSVNRCAKTSYLQLVNCVISR